MKIIVLIKQVPETANARMNEASGTIVREGVENIVNPLDLYAVETALRLKSSRAAKVGVLTMGPGSAEKCLKEALAMGCDDGTLLSCPEFAGSDTLATATVLSKACEKSGFDLILTGERATDGETAQVGPEVAALLDIPIGAYVSAIVELKENGVVVERLLENGVETLYLPFPCLLTVVKEIAVPRLPTLRGKQRARAVTAPRWKLADLEGLTAEETGLNGSPTRVIKIETPKVMRHGVLIRASEPGETEKAARELADFLKKRNLLSERCGNE